MKTSPLASRPANDRVPDENRFLTDVLDGLGQQPQKRLNPKYFYDPRGCELFGQIQRLDEYYITRCEEALIAAHLEALGQALADTEVMVELGGGSGRRTTMLLDLLPNLRHYMPVDIAAEALAQSRGRSDQLPGFTTLPLHADFSQPFDLPGWLPEQGVTIYFPGSTIGNFEPDEAVALLTRLRNQVKPGNRLLLTADMTRDEATLHAAYNDAEGVTAQFNLNLLARINRELNADFDLTQFTHRAWFNRALSRVEMHLVSSGEQQVTVGADRFHFAAGETIHTENSHKYTMTFIRALAGRAGWRHTNCWMDPDARVGQHLMVRA